MPVLIHEVEYLGEVTTLLVDEHGILVTPSHWPAEIQIIDGKGLQAFPGLFDVHVHFRDPGFTEKEDLLSGARAAAAGGYVGVLCEPNTQPIIDTSDAVLRHFRRCTEQHIPLDLFPKAAVTLGEQGRELTDFNALANAGAVAFSDDGEPILNPDLLVHAFRQSAGYADSPYVITAHCEETPRSLAQTRERFADHALYACELLLIAMHLEALEQAGCGRLHIQHVSQAASVSLIARAKTQGLAVTAEVTPHHLLLCQDDIPVGDTNWKMNPPLRRREDMLAMRAALATGVIDCIATDHAPHTLAEKAQAWEQAPFGIIGLECALALCLSLVADGTLSLVRLQQAMALAPRALLPRQVVSALSGGLTLIDREHQWTIDAERFYSKGRNCPFDGRVVAGAARYTIAHGQVVMAENEVLF